MSEAKKPSTPAEIREAFLNEAVAGATYAGNAIAFAASIRFGLASGVQDPAALEKFRLDVRRAIVAQLQGGIVVPVPGAPGKLAGGRHL